MSKQDFGFEVWQDGVTKRHIIVLNIQTKNPRTARRYGSWASWHLARMFRKSKSKKVKK